MSKSLTLAIIIVVWWEFSARFLLAPQMYTECIDNSGAEMAEYCSCMKDSVVEKRYYLAYFTIIQAIENKSTELEYKDIPGYYQCSEIKDDIIKRKISENIESDLRRSVINHLSDRAKDLLKDIELTDFALRKETGNKYGTYIANIQFTVSSGTFGIVRTMKFQGKFYYSSKGELINKSWEQIGSDVDAQEAIDGARQIYEFLNN